MKKLTCILYFLFSFALVLSSCSLFKKTTNNNNSVTVTAPPPKPVVKDTTEKTTNVVTAAPFNVPEFSREIKKAVYHVAVFSPLYLDSLSADSSIGQGTTIPAYFAPGLEFYEGAKLALDSLRSQGYQLAVDVYDTKSASGNVDQLLRQGKLDSTDLIIGIFNYQELRAVADFSKQHMINLISATYPNDGGVKKDPFFIIVNSTLQAHCQAIMKYALNNFNNINLVVFRKDNIDENTISEYLKSSYHQLNGDNIVPLHEVQYDTSWSAADFAHHLNPQKNNIVIICTLNDPTALNVTQKLASLTTTYQLNVIGMPTWDDIRDFYKNNDFYSLPIFYSTPYYNDKKNPVSQYLINNFTKSYNLPYPSDMAFKGFDITYYFLRLMHNFGIYFNARLNDPQAPLISQYNFQPVYIDSYEKQPDYFENMHLYFVKIYQGNAYPAGSE